MRIGLKLYSSNTDLIPEAQRLKSEKYFDYVELYTIPGTYKKTIHYWKKFDVPYVIHAPHSFQGTNFAQVDKWETNLENFNQAQLFANELGADIIIIHGGNNGSIYETIRQIKLLDEQRIVIENKPKVGLNNELCIGWSPSEFRIMSDEGILQGIALDFVHASCAACSLNINPMLLVEELMLFNPKIYHISDGNILSEKDSHFNLGKGNYNLSNFISVIPVNGLLTLETPRDPSKGLMDFVDDVNFLSKISNK